jgi:RHS repeat-associated protein
MGSAKILEVRVLYQNYFRDYDPAVGRYLESDPYGLDAGINPYVYVASDPVNGDDPLGLYTLNPGVPPPSLALDAFLQSESGIGLDARKRHKGEGGTGPGSPSRRPLANRRARYGRRNTCPGGLEQPPGEYRDVYGKKEIRATRPVIVFAGYESWAIVYAWTGKHIAKVWIAD